MNKQYLTETVLKNLSSGELMRLAERKMKIEAERPVPLADADVDLTALKAALENHIEDVAGGNADSDTPHYIFEAALEAFYGNGIWTWIRERD